MRDKTTNLLDLDSVMFGSVGQWPCPHLYPFQPEVKERQVKQVSRSNRLACQTGQQVKSLAGQTDQQVKQFNRSKRSAGQTGQQAKQVSRSNKSAGPTGHKVKQVSKKKVLKKNSV